MFGVDLNLFRFNYDLTFNALIMNADGTIYHTFGGRSVEDADEYLSMEKFESVLRASFEEHAHYEKAPTPPSPAEPMSVDKIPWAARKIEAGQGMDCYHCHTVHDALYEDARERDAWTIDQAWRWPDPVQIGIQLDPSRQNVVAAVREGSQAERAGLRSGDEILTLIPGADATQPKVAGAKDGTDPWRPSVLTFGDVQRALHEASPGNTHIAFSVDRDGVRKAGKIALDNGWKQPTPAIFAWRATKWRLSPKPGFGGPVLTTRQLKSLGLPEDRFAFRLQYMVTWGDHAHTGRNAARAGLRQGDIVLSVAGKDDFESGDHFHAWFRLTQKPGTTVPIEILRGGKRRKIELPVIE